MQEMIAAGALTIDVEFIPAGCPMLALDKVTGLEFGPIAATDATTHPGRRIPASNPSTKDAIELASELRKGWKALALHLRMLAGIAGPAGLGLAGRVQVAPQRAQR